MRHFDRGQNPYRLLWAASDALVWALAIWFARWLRYDFEPHRFITWGTVIVAIGAAPVHLLFGFLIGPYGIGHLRASFEEILDLTKAVLATMVVVLVPVCVASPILVPRSVPITGAALALMTMFAMRLAVRSWKIRQRPTDGKRRMVVFGAGEGGRLLLHALTRDSASSYAPVALLDDSALKQRLTIEGVPVKGTRDDLEEVASAYRADILAIAVPSADSALIRDLTERAEACGLSTLVLPPATELVGGLSSTDLRDVNLADLLGRRPIRLDTTAIAESIAGKRILVTGAGGSIGSELCRQISRFGPATAGHARPRRVRPPRRAARPRRQRPSGERRRRPRRYPRPHRAPGGLHRGEARHGLPRGRAEASPAARALPPRGLALQRPRHPERPHRLSSSSGSGPSSTSRPTRPRTRRAPSVTASAWPSG